MDIQKYIKKTTVQGRKIKKVFLEIEPSNMKITCVANLYYISKGKVIL